MSIKGEQKDTLICPLPRSNNPSSSAIKNGELAETEFLMMAILKLLRKLHLKLKHLLENKCLFWFCSESSEILNKFTHSSN